MQSLPFPNIFSIFRSRLIFVVLVAQCFSTAARAQQGDETDSIDFNRDIRPILADHCFQCHGPDSATREAGLRLDRRDASIAELDSGEFAIVPGDSRSSEVILRVTHEDDDLRMPPPELNKAVSNEQVALLRRWIDGGAKYATHWAFVKARTSARYRAERQRREPAIDYFVRLQHQARGLNPTGTATRETLIRRLSFDIRGLPPTLEEIDRFVRDPSVGAYPALVDRLLASSSYGERMATMWLDWARFADTNGYQNDFNRYMWPYRDWVINAFNENKPFDEFTIEQIAGDLLTDPTEDQIVATGFNRNNRTVTEGGSIEEEWLVENVVDRVETTGAAFLGLTIGCARCHDHKFDPISQREFYQFFDFFHQVDEKGFYQEARGNVEPKISIIPLDRRKELESWDSEINLIEKKLAELKPKVDNAFDEWSRDIKVLGAAKPDLHLPLDGSRNYSFGAEGQGKLVAGTAIPGNVKTEIGSALEFASEQWLDAGQEFAPVRDKSFSVSIWTRCDDTGAIISKMEKPEGFRGFDVLPFNGKFVSSHLISKWPNDAIKVYTRDALLPKVMNHVVLTYDGSETAEGVHIYINGKSSKLVVEKDSLQGEITNSIPLQIGRRSGGNFYDGVVQDIRCFNRELSSAEISMLLIEKVGPRYTSDSPEHFPTVLRQAYVELGLDPASQEFTRLKSRHQELTDKRDKLKSNLPSVMVMRERKAPRATYVLTRGQYDLPDKSQKVTADVPACLPPMNEEWPKNRLGLARWLVSRENPLTARVFVNRIWEQFFGVGLVKSSENFGYRADLPSHPELLDHLSAEFVDSGWDVKTLIRTIVTSETYRRTSAAEPSAYELDPENRWLSRGPRFRLGAEFVRDNALAVSGLLSSRIGGPSVKPYQPDGLWDELAGGANGGPYKVAEGDDLYRRSLYTFRKRTVPHPTMATFDAPSFEFCQVKRAVTNTPLQALALLNDTTYVEASRKLAERMLKTEGESARDRIVFAFRLCTGRYPRKEELNKLTVGFEKYAEHFSRHSKDAEAFIKHGKSSSELPEGVEAKKMAAYTALASALLNLDETITKE